MLKKLLLSLLLTLSACSNLEVVPNVVPEEYPQYEPTPVVESIVAQYVPVMEYELAAKFPGNHIDYLALARESTSRITSIGKVLRPGTFVGVLDYTFGKVDPNLRRLIRTGKIGAFRKHCFNGAGKRNGRLQPNEPRVTDLKELAKCAQAAQETVYKFPHVGCFLSPVLEHDETNKDLVNSWVKILRDNAPSCEVVISPYKGIIPSGVTPEKHGNRATSAITSNDGESLFDANTGNAPVKNFPNYLDSATKIVFGWVHRFNWNATGLKTFVKPLERKARPEIWHFELVQEILDREESLANVKKPAVCRTVRDLKERELWKVAAEDYNNADSRANKPLLISKINKKMDLIDQSGKVIGCLNCPLSGGCSYSGDRGYYRYYSGSCGPKASSLDLLKKAKSEWIYIRNGNECIRTNAIRRKGYFRLNG